MAVGGLSRIVSQDFSAGMFPSLAPELIPSNGAFDITNGLLNEQNVVYRRGGTAYFSTAPAGGSVRALWSGYLKHGGLQTILCTSTGSYRIEADRSLKAIGLVAPAVLSPAVVFQGVLYLPGGHTWDGETAGTDGRGATSFFYAVAGNHLVVGAGARISVSLVPKAEGETVAWKEETNFLQLPEGVAITGMAGWRTSVVVFTTQGIWLISGLEHNEIVDSNGNIQWRQDRYSTDAVLWGAAGVAGWKGGLVVPCKDDVWLMQLGVSSEKAAPFRSLSGPIENVYRGYIAAGYTPGQAVVFNGHYFLPVLSGSSVIDMLVCRLEGVNDSGKPEPAWSHFADYGARLTALTSTVSDVEGPLIGATAGVARVLRLGWFTPSGALENDADGSPISFELTTRSIPTGNLVRNLVAKGRLSYRMVSPAGTTIKLAFGETPYRAAWGEFAWGEADWTQATGPFTDLGASIPPAKADPEAVVPKVWVVRRKVRFARMRISLNGPASQVSIRALELFVRPDGRVI